MSNNNDNLPNLSLVRSFLQAPVAPIISTANASTFTTVLANPSTGEVVKTTPEGKIFAAKRNNIPPAAASSLATLSSAAIPIPENAILENAIPENKEKDVKGQMSIELPRIRFPREIILDEVFPLGVSGIVSEYDKSQDPFDLFKEFYNIMNTLKNLSEEVKKKLWVDFAKKTQPNCLNTDEFSKDNIDIIIEKIGKILTQATDDVILDICDTYSTYSFKRGTNEDKQKSQELSRIYPQSKLARKFKHILDTEEFIRRPENHCIIESLEEVFLRSVPGMDFVFPNLLKECSNLKFLSLRDISMSFPLEIFNFKKLNILYMKNCSLLFLLDDFNKLSKLDVLGFEDNLIKNIPESLIRIIEEGSINSLLLSNNQLSVEEIEKIKQAEKIGNKKRNVAMTIQVSPQRQ